MRDSLVRLRDLGLNPEVIVDIGAYDGRWARMASELFPASRILSFEAQPGMEPKLQEAVAACPNIEYTIGLLGETPRQNVPFFVMDTESGSTGSSMYQENTAYPRKQITLDIRTLNDVVAGKNVQKADLIKLDTQGSELDILRGGEGFWNTAQAVIIEVSYIDYNIGGVLATDVIRYMAERGYIVFDIAETHRGRNGILMQADLVFVPEASKFRDRSCWAW